MTTIASSSILRDLADGSSIPAGPLVLFTSPEDGKKRIGWIQEVDYDRKYILVAQEQEYTRITFADFRRLQVQLVDIDHKSPAAYIVMRYKEAMEELRRTRQELFELLHFNGITI